MTIAQQLLDAWWAERCDGDKCWISVDEKRPKKHFIGAVAVQPDGAIVAIIYECLKRHDSKPFARLHIDANGRVLQAPNAIAIFMTKKRKQISIDTP